MLLSFIPPVYIHPSIHTRPAGETPAIGLV